MSSTDPDLEQRLKTLEDELTERRKSEAIKDSIILEYRQALSDAQFKISVLNGQLKIIKEPTAEHGGFHHLRRSCGYCHREPEGHYWRYLRKP